MADVHVVTGPETNLLRSDGQMSELFIAGVENPPVVLAASVVSAEGTDMILSITYGSVTEGAYTDVLPDMTCWVGTGPGKQDVGIVRVRKAPTSSILYVGEVSEVDWTIATHITVVDSMDLFPRHVRIIDKVPYMDGDIAYTDQTYLFDPTPLMGPDVVLDVSQYPVQVTFPDAGDSYAIDSTIASWLWQSNAGSWSGHTTSDPTLTVTSYPANGRIRVSLTLVSAAGKSFTAYRYIYVYDSAHPPIKIHEASNMRVTRDQGCWTCTVSLDASASVTQIQDHTPIILFSRDWFDGARTSMGTLEGRENMCMPGWIVGNTVLWTPDGSSVQFEVQGAPGLLDQMLGYPPGVEMSTSTPTAWTSVPNLTVQKAIWLLLHWRCTATRRMDVRITNDARMGSKFATPSAFIWSQIKEIGGRSILVSPGCDKFGRLFIDVHPQLMPVASRTWNTCQDYEKIDWHDKISIRDRSKVTRVAQVVLSGVSVDASLGYSTFFSLSNGHIPKRFGSVDVRDKLLLSSQAQSNELAGLLMAWQNIDFEIEIDLSQNNPFPDVFPNNFNSITIAETDTIRGKAYSGNLVLEEVERVWDSNNHSLTTNIKSVPEVFPEIAVNGDIPGASADIDISKPPRKYSVPALPKPVYLAPPVDIQTNTHPKEVLIASTNYGLFYTKTFDKEDMNILWLSMNEGLSILDRNKVTSIAVTPSGAIYILANGVNATGWLSLYRASGLGGAWTEVLDGAVFDAAFAQTESLLWGLAVDPTEDDRIAVLGGRIWTWPSNGNIGYCCLAIGENGTFTLGGVHYYFRGGRADIVFADDGWNVFANLGTGILGSIVTYYSLRFTNEGAVDGATVSDFTGNPGNPNYACAAGAQDKCFYWNPSNSFKVTDAGMTLTPMTLHPPGIQGIASSPGGTFLMGSEGTGPRFSSDSGATWLVTPLTIGPTVWENCRDNYRWIFGGGANIRFTPDQGSTSFNKIGTLLWHAALIDIELIKYIR